VVFGAWSDKVGRKWIMMAGMLVGILMYRPIYNQFVVLTDIENIKKDQPVSGGGYLVKREMINNGGDSLITSTSMNTLAGGMNYKETNADTLYANGHVGKTKTIYTEKKLPSSIYWKFVLLVFVQIIFVTMVYGPIAAFLVELFPTKIRYTSMSLPYHVGNGVFGGLTPFIATLLTTIYTGDKLVGLWYPIGVAAVCLLIGVLYVNNHIDPDVND
jgi:MFS family permease